MPQKKTVALEITQVENGYIIRSQGLDYVAPGGPRFGEDFSDIVRAIFENSSQPHNTIFLSNYGHNKINCIKIFRDATGAGLKEAKDAIELCEDREECRRRGMDWYAMNLARPFKRAAIYTGPSNIVQELARKLKEAGAHVETGFTSLEDIPF